jgi:hypothetical protein
VLSALIAVAGSLLGVVLGFSAQHLQAGSAHRRHLDDLKREAYAELLRAVSASYAQASSGGGTSEGVPLKATAVILLLAGSEIGSAARSLENQVSMPMCCCGNRGTRRPARGSTPRISQGLN